MNLQIHLALALCLASFSAIAQPTEAGQPADAGQTSAPASPAPDAAADPIATIPLAPEPAPPLPVADTQASTGAIEEVIVTASKRKENARTLAGAVTAVTRERLDETGSSNFADYLALSPGVNLSSGNPGVSTVTIRGVSTDTMPTTGQSAVGIYYDDIPLTDPGTPVLVPDIDAYDAERIEVLRGPQGALFGSSSLGGALNYIPQAPNPSAFAFTGQASGSRTKNAATGFSAKMMTNVPLVDDAVGLRLVGYYTEAPGWIDNVGTGVDGANDSRIAGGRAMLGWDVTPESSLRLTGLYQRAVIDDTAFVDDSGDLKKNTLVPEPARNDITIGALHYDYDTDFGTLSLIGGYQDKNNESVSDQTAFLGLQALGVPFVGSQAQAVDGYSAELRFASNAGEFFEYLIGVSYANRDETLETLIDTNLLALPREIVSNLFASLGLTPPAVLGATRLIYERVDQKAPEAAAFIDTTFHLTSRLKLAAGGRFYRNTVDADISGQGVLLAPSGSLTFNDTSKTTASGFNPRVSLAYEFGKDIMVYGLYSRGYRLGGINLVPDTPVSPTKTEYGSDQVNNYELGAKTRWLDGALTVDMTGFYIDWKDIPLQVQDRLGLFKYLDNVGDARIFGIETSLAVRPADFLTLRSAVTWNKATLQNFYDPQNGRPPVEPGDRLPGSPEWTISNTVSAHWYVAGITPIVTLIHRYESKSPSSLSYQDVTKGGYNQFDARIGAQIGSFGVTLFGRNLGDVRGITAVQPYARATGGALYRRDFIIMPRTFGLELNYSFGQ
ncbi:MAG TPA: TonB-dependent receptor [Solimonas sp.]|nr:TonB-dependent receptor [Solimonas sp.]